MDSRRVRRFAALSTVCISLVAASSDLHAKPCPPLRPVSEPVIVGFTGWNPPIINHPGSAVDQIADSLRKGGLSAEVHPSSDWPDVAERLAARGSSDNPIVLIGYSMGAAAAIHVAQKLGSLGLPVSKIVVVEAWNPEPVPANVGEATHFYSTRFASRIKPGPGNTGTIENIDLNGRVAGIEEATHVTMSQMAAVQDFVIDRIRGAAAEEPTGDKIQAKAGRSSAASRRAAARCTELRGGAVLPAPGR